MEKLCIVCKKIPTNAVDGRCAVCRVYGNLTPQASQRELQKEKPKKKEKLMPVTKENMGRKCNCVDCFKFAVKGGMCTRHFNEAHGIGKRIGRKPKKPAKDIDSTCSVEGCDNVVKSVGKKSKKDSGQARMTEKDINPLRTYILIDLSDFPKIHRYCTALDFVAPSDMLGVLLRKRFKELEEIITI